MPKLTNPSHQCHYRPQGPHHEHLENLCNKIEQKFQKDLKHWTIWNILIMTKLTNLSNQGHNRPQGVHPDHQLGQICTHIKFSDGPYVTFLQMANLTHSLVPHKYTTRIWSTWTNSTRYEPRSKF